MLPDNQYPPLPCNKLQKLLKSQHKFIRKDDNQSTEVSERADKSLKSSNNGNKSLKTLATNDEHSSNKGQQLQQQLYIDSDGDSDADDNCCDVEVMCNKEAKMSSTTKAVATRDRDDADNNRSDVTTTKLQWYSNISASEFFVRGIGEVDAENVTPVADDGNNHWRSPKRRKVMDDNNTNVASANSNDDKQNLDTDATNNSRTNIKRSKDSNRYHKVSNRNIDSDETVEQQNKDHKAAFRRSDETDVVDNCSVDNLKYNEHHKSFAATSSATATHFVAHSIKRESIAKNPTKSSLISSIPFSSSQQSENHRRQYDGIHQQSLSSLPQTSSSYDYGMQSYQRHTQHYHQEEHQSIQHHIPNQQHQYIHQQEEHQPKQQQQEYVDISVPSLKVSTKNYGSCSTGGGETAAQTAEESTTSLTICELASPRCQSRESTASLSASNDVRCPSNESHYSANETHTSGQTPTPTTPPVALPLPATLPPAAAAALLPPQSAAMAAYLNAAAAAAQQNHLLLTNPLAAAASFVQQAQQQHQQQQSSHSPNLQQASTPPTTAVTTGALADASALDFSTKRGRINSNDEDGNASEDDAAAGGYMDETRNDNDADNANDNEMDDVNSPLDLSLNNGRKRQGDASEEPVVMPNRKLARSNDYKSLPASSTWVPPINPYLAAVAAASMSPKTPISLDWNSKSKISPNEATKALEKMTEMTRLGASASELETPTRHSTNSVSSNSSTGAPSNGRHSAWQSHWLNKGADAVKDVFKCVWCKQSFATLASLTTHMKETQHCGVNVPPTVAASAANAANTGGNQTLPSSHHARHPTTQSTSNSPASSGSKSDLNMLIKETMPLPRKLVRGQDVWLGKGAEQTRQILKCMWCGQSFRSLAEMTSHMQETQHYTNIISQEQIISWKSTDDKGSRDNSSCGSSNRGCPSTASANANNNSTVAHSPSPTGHNANAMVSAVLTCKVCDQAFPTLKELSAHMVKNNHYTEQMVRTNTPVQAESAPTMIRSRNRQGKEKRKKSLPVRKLLEMERAQQDFKTSNTDPAFTPLKEFKATTKLQCETCGDKFGIEVFVEHIRQCTTYALEKGLNPKAYREEISKSPYIPQSQVADYGNRPQTPNNRTDSRKTAEENAPPPSPLDRADILCPLPSESDKSSSATSVLNALEQLIEKSFDARPRHAAAYGESASTPLGSSILKRLGIDDNVDYTKPLMDPQTMQFLRSYSHYPSSSRDRSASESSSISERCSSRLESFTPERNYEQSRQPTPRLTPDRTQSNTKELSYPIRIKSEPLETNDAANEPENIPVNEIPRIISVKKEFSMTDSHEDYEHSKTRGSELRRSSVTAGSRSPSISERSITPKSTTSIGDKKSSVGLPESSSLNALSSMFNNLHNMHSASTAVATSIESNNNHNTTSAETAPRRSNANPLAALQKLCETTEKPAANTRSSSASLQTHSACSSASSTMNGLNAAGGSGGCAGGSGSAATGGNSGSGMLAFSWACNDAVVTADSIIKCSFCDTPFSSKGAYRHHLSKVHFVKEEIDAISLKSPGFLTATSPKSLTTSPKSMTSSQKSPAIQRLDATPPSNITTPSINPYDESPQSKFLKYTELAKQLSSKNS